MRPEGAPTVERTSAAEVERFLEAERTEARALDRFGEMFTGRPVAKLDLGAVFDDGPSSTRTRAELEDELAAIPMAEIADLSARFRAARKEADLLGRARAGAVREEALRFRGKPIPKAEIPRALSRLDDDVKSIDKRFEQLDEVLIGVHARMARALAPERATTLRRRYALVLRLQSSLLGLRAAHARVVPYLIAMGSGQRLGEGDAQAFLERIEDLRNEIAGVLERSEGRKLPAMQNVAAGTELASFLLPRAMQPPRPEPALTGRWIGQVLADSGEVSDKLERLHKKSIAGMVLMLDRIERDWRAAKDAEDATSPPPLGPP
jgi:hypothetical protein